MELKKILIAALLYVGSVFAAAISEAEIYLRNDSPGHEVEVDLVRAGVPIVSKRLFADNDVIYLGKVKSTDRISYKIFGAIKTHPTYWIEWQDILNQNSPRVLVQFYKGAILPGLQLSAFTGFAPLMFEQNRLIKSVQVKSLDDALKLVKIVSAGRSDDVERDLGYVEKLVGNAGIDVQAKDTILKSIETYRKTKNAYVLGILVPLLTQYYQSANLELQNMG